MPISIPTEDTLPTTDISHKITLIYGQRKIGKSVFCSHAPAPLFLATEPGQSHIKTRRIPIASWRDFQESYIQIRAGEHDRKTIIIDTIDNLYKFCREHVLREAGLQHEQDQGYGRGYDLVNGAFFKAINSLALLPYGLMMISHSQEKEVKDRVGRKYQKTTCTLPPGGYKIVNGIADYILYAEVDETTTDEGTISGFKHVLRCKPTTIYDAGMRLAEGQDFPDTIPLNYAAFEAALTGKALPTDDTTNTSNTQKGTAAQQQTGKTK